MRTQWTIRLEPGVDVNHAVALAGWHGARAGMEAPARVTVTTDGELQGDPSFEVRIPEDEEIGIPAEIWREILHAVELLPECSVEIEDDTAWLRTSKLLAEVYVEPIREKDPESEGDDT